MVDWSVDSWADQLENQRVELLAEYLVAPRAWMMVGYLVD